MKYPFYLLIVIIAGFLWEDAAAQSKPQAVIKSPSWDYGYLPQKCEVSHSFYLYNAGSAPLTVSKIKADCSCTGVSKVDQPIAPGDSAEILVTFKSGRYHGLVKKSAEITTDDPDAPAQRVRFTSNVVKSGEATGGIAVLPYKLTWKIENGKIAPATDTIRITNNSTDSMAITILHEPGEIVTHTEIPREMGPGGSGDLILHISKEYVSDKAEWFSTTLAFTGGDTTIVTVPIEIEK